MVPKYFSGNRRGNFKFSIYEKMKKIKLAIIFGGPSAEHEVSVRSAKNVTKAIDKEKYDIYLIWVSREREWYLVEKFEKKKKIIMINKEIRDYSTYKCITPIDVVFPLIHGPYGEDGVLQGFLTTLDIPFIGSDVVGSAIGMDKDVSKRLLREAGLKIANFIVIRKGEEIDFDSISTKLGLPLFIKPANLGSSVGISKVKRRKEFFEAIEKAFEYDFKILIEEYIEGREIECSVLGGNPPLVSLPGENIIKSEFYSYSAKYIDKTSTSTQIPAKLPKNVIKKIQSIALQVFEILCCEDMGRVDFFLTKENSIIVNEINTIPGFTEISMYPKLWEVSGITYSQLIDRLIELAMRRYQIKKNLNLKVK
jgi:D-alanine-D-alanine ligase